MSFYPFVLHEISVLIELILGHLRYCLTDVPPQPNSQPDYVFRTDRITKIVHSTTRSSHCKIQIHEVSKATLRVVVFHWR